VSERGILPAGIGGTRRSRDVQPRLAAIRSNLGEAGGLDAALRTLAGQPFGTVLLIAVAIGLAAFGVYCFAAARSHRT
jgi:hypothetical protein